MSSISSAASADLALASNELECEPSRSARLRRSNGQSSPSTGPMSLVTTTSEPLAPIVSDQTEFPWMLSAEDSPVRTSARRASELALMESGAASGESTPALLASYDHVSSSWRTSQLCLVEGLTVFSETWPRSGMMRSGTAYRLPPLAPLTSETEFGLWATPTVNGNYNRKGASPTSGDGLATQVRKWPTPTASDADKWSHQSLEERKSKGQQVRLPTAVSPEGGAGGSLNPTWVEWLMGFPLEWTALKDWAMRSSRKSRS